MLASSQYPEQGKGAEGAQDLLAGGDLPEAEAEWSAPAANASLPVAGRQRRLTVPCVWRRPGRRWGKARYLGSLWLRQVPSGLAAGGSPIDGSLGRPRLRLALGASVATTSEGGFGVSGVVIAESSALRASRPMRHPAAWSMSWVVALLHDGHRRRARPGDVDEAPADIRTAEMQTAAVRPGRCQICFEKRPEPPLSRRAGLFCVHVSSPDRSAGPRSSKSSWVSIRVPPDESRPRTMVGFSAAGTNAFFSRTGVENGGGGRDVRCPRSCSGRNRAERSRRPSIEDGPPDAWPSSPGRPPRAPSAGRGVSCG